MFDQILLRVPYDIFGEIATDYHELVRVSSTLVGVLRYPYEIPSILFEITTCLYEFYYKSFARSVSSLYDIVRYTTTLVRNLYDIVRPSCDSVRYNAISARDGHNLFVFEGETGTMMLQPSLHRLRVHMQLEEGDVELDRGHTLLLQQRRRRRRTPRIIDS